MLQEKYFMVTGWLEIMWADNLPSPLPQTIITYKRQQAYDSGLLIPVKLLTSQACRIKQVKEIAELDLRKPNKPRGQRAWTFSLKQQGVTDKFNKVGE